MPITMHDEGASVFRIEIRGTLRKADLEQHQRALLVEMNRLGPVKLRFVLEGWDPADNWTTCHST